MIKRQQRIEWIASAAKEYLAAKSAAVFSKARFRPIQTMEVIRAGKLGMGLLLSTIWKQRT
jgi:hypothetical protein